MVRDVSGFLPLSSTSRMETEKRKTTRFYPKLDVLLLREVLARKPTTKREWEGLSAHVNECIRGDHVFVTLRACKDRIRHLQEAHRKDEVHSLRA